MTISKPIAGKVERIVFVSLIAAVTACSQALWAEARSGEGLSPAAKEMARDIGVRDGVLELSASRFERSKSGLTDDGAVNRLHGKLLDRIILSWLQVRATIAKIDQNIAESNELRDQLSSDAERNVKRAGIAAFINAGIGESLVGVGLVASSMQLPAAVVSVYGGVMEAGLSFWALKLEKGRRVKSRDDPNMLAAVLRCQPAEAQYPPLVWEYLNDRAAGDAGQKSRIELLRQHWIKSGHIPEPSTEAGRRLIPLIASSRSEKKAISIGLLTNRLMMLNDLRAVVSGMDRSLSEVVGYVISLDPERS